MTRITQVVLGQAARAVGRMGAPERLRLADEVFTNQPNLLASIVVLERMGASNAQIEVPLHILLVAWQAMKSCGSHWPLISEDDQDACMQRLTGKIRFVEGLSPQLLRQTVEQQTDAHAERYLLAFAFGHLGDNRLLGARTRAEKNVLLAALNLVECIASMAPRATPAAVGRA